MSYLSIRPNWQLNANQCGNKHELTLFEALKSVLPADQYEVTRRPDWFGQPYLEYCHSISPMTKPEAPQDGDVWFDENTHQFMKMTVKPTSSAAGGTLMVTVISPVRETFVPDIGIRHLATGHRYVLECKYQKAEGNAHERVCKYMTPGLIHIIKNKLGANYHPIGYAFDGGIACDAGYRREILAFAGPSLSSHVFFWVDQKPESVREWFMDTIHPLLSQPE